MKKYIFMILMLIISIKTYSQKKNTVGISIPIIWNSSNGVYYSTGNRQEPSGEAISYGINVNYSRLLYKGLFVTAGAGYFKQRFEIERPFKYIDPNGLKPLYYTKEYTFHSFHLQTGIGYKQKISKNFSIDGLVTYNLLNSYKQEYIPRNLSLQNKSTQTNTQNMSVGYFVNLSIGGEKLITQRIGVGVDILIPVVTKWRKDEIFIDTGWSEDQQVIAQNKFSIGTAISCKYHF